MASEIVVVDTDIYSSLYIDPDRAKRRDLPVEEWRTLLAGKHVFISFQTRAEVLMGVRYGNWGARKLAAVHAKLDSAPTIPADREVIDAYATLYATCRRTGHALWAKDHTADRWIAASAVAKGLPLLARDHIYRDAPGLALHGGS